MRQSRAPTASQIQNPPPPSASTKGGRLFGRANIGMSGAEIAKGEHLANSELRPHIPQVCPPWRIRPRPREEAFAAGEDGEERHAINGACGP